jgi:hypothetical protein
MTEEQLIHKQQLNKCLNLIEYKVKSECELSFGKYVWCSNMEEFHESGFKLTNSDVKDTYGDMNTHCLNIILLLNPKLHNDAFFIDLYDHNGGLFGYNVTPLKLPFFIKKTKINKKLIGTEITVKFSKKKILIIEQQKNMYTNFKRTPRDVIFEHKFIIPDIKIYSNNECNICLENVINITDKYITTCGHLFHLDCIFNFFENNNLLYPLHKYCSSKFGCQTRHCKVFDCPVCRHLVIP